MTMQCTPHESSEGLNRKQISTTEINTDGIDKGTCGLIMRDFKLKAAQFYLNEANVLHHLVKGISWMPFFSRAECHYKSCIIFHNTELDVCDK